MEYLPEWKIYLWEKLLLDKQSDSNVRKINDFVFFNTDDQYGAMIQQTQKMLNQVEAAAWAEGTTSSGTGTPLDDSYYSFEPEKVLAALIELADGRLNTLKITGIRLDKAYIAKYRQTRGNYLAQEEKKRVAGLSSGTVSKREPDINYFNNKFCGLGEDIFHKVDSSQELNLADLKKITLHPVSFLLELLTFTIQIDKTALARKLHDYIVHFMHGDLMRPPKVRYYSYEQQREKISNSIKLLAKIQGDKNISMTLAELAEVGKWNPGEEGQFRFYETLLALWIVGQIMIHDLRKEEVVISLTDAFETEKTANKEKVISPFDLEKTTAMIKSASDFETAKKKWFPVKGVLDAIDKKLAPLDDVDGIVKESITLTGLTPEQKDVLPVVLKHAYDNGIVDMSRPDRKKQKKQYTVISSEPVRKFLAGENLWIENIDKFNEYRGKINSLCDFIEKNSRVESPEVSTSPIHSAYRLKRVPLLPHLSTADEKRLHILEKLKEEWDLLPKQSSGPTMLQAGVVIYRQKAGYAQIHWNRFHVWFQEYGIDADQLNNILTTFQQESLIEHFDTISEYR